MIYERVKLRAILNLPEDDTHLWIFITLRMALALENFYLMASEIYIFIGDQLFLLFIFESFHFSLVIEFNDDWMSGLKDFLVP
ncbi:Uncharacterized protein TCM_013930 [Theobroma cacao]|uniref:Uncharacterized protein n=1 Tax=Theobroma cacao TaxID=3641 RepID=A0A061FY44_THECC|nr:Uncharacterized protein TCM_013930 [Theobroma cacao]